MAEIIEFPKRAAAVTIRLSVEYETPRSGLYERLHPSGDVAVANDRPGVDGGGVAATRDLRPQDLKR